MRRTAANAAALALAILCGSALWAGPLLAKPTRMLTRTTAHKLVLTPASHHALHSRAEAPARSSTAYPRSSGRSSSRSARSSAGNPSSSRSVRAALNRTRTNRLYSLPPRTLARERAVAALAAIAAADRGPRDAAHHSKGQHNLTQAVRVSRGISPEVDELAESDLSRQEEPAARSTVLTNVGGVLRTVPGPLSVVSATSAMSAPAFLPPLHLSSLYDSGGRLILPRPLYGSHEILLHQNEMAERDGLDRVQDDSDLLELRREKKLVALPESTALRVDYRLPEDRRYSRPWTAAFLSLLATDFFTTFHTPLQVDSAVRTVAVQRRLLRTNGNAAPTTGEAASPHLTGQAVDIAKGGLNLAQIAWMRTYLQPWIDLGKIDVEEEFQQSCFHISVYRSFLPTAPPHGIVATARQAASESEPERSSY